MRLSPLMQVLAACGLMLGLTGCTVKTYKITFESAPVINAPGDDGSRSSLDVDVLCLTPENNKTYPELADGVARSADWFKSKAENNSKYGKVPAAQIFAMRHGDASSIDTKKSDSVTSAKDRLDGGNSVTIEVTHPNPGDKKSAIVIFGRFFEKPGVVARTQPVVIRPLPTSWKNPLELIIRVDRSGMTWKNPQQ